MSTEYRPVPPIPFRSLIDGLPVGIKAPPHEANGELTQCIEDVYDNVLWVYSDPDGSSVTIERFGANVPDVILLKLWDTFGVEFLSEHDDGYEETLPPDDDCLTDDMGLEFGDDVP